MSVQVTVVSDLHLETGYQELPGGEVLILSGDICEARSLATEFRRTRLVEHTPGDYPYVDFFNIECAKYDQVFYVPGNHEHYRGRFDKTANVLRDIMPDNIKVMDRDVFEYRGIMFMGATMWTDMNKNDPVTLWTTQNVMSDFKSIQNHYVDRGVYHKLTPEFTVAEHRKTLGYFKQQLDANPEQPFVIMTHHAPSHLSIDPYYMNATTMNGAYVSDLSGFILDHPQIKLWSHGHVHNQFDYQIGDTRIVCNPRGYVGYENTSQFKPGFNVEI